jgi:hypothetical protein
MPAIREVKMIPNHRRLRYHNDTQQPTASSRWLLSVLGQRKQKGQHLFRRNPGEIAFAKLGWKTGWYELTNFDYIFLELVQ